MIVLTATTVGITVLATINYYVLTLFGPVGFVVWLILIAAMASTYLIHLGGGGYQIDSGENSENSENSEK